MPASYPTSLPVKNAAGANLSTDPHSALHDGKYDEIVAIATELGTSPKGTFASVKARLDANTLGTVAFAARITSQSTITTAIDVTSLTVTWTATATRRYRTSFYCHVQSTVADDYAVVDIFNGTTPAGSAIARGAAVCRLANQGLSLVGSVTETGLTGSQTRRLVARRQAGTGAITVESTVSYPSYILVEDIGT